jgi:predicted  nucleic acid-binding Zn-ribbon protein
MEKLMRKVDRIKTDDEFRASVDALRKEIESLAPPATKKNGGNGKSEAARLRAQVEKLQQEKRLLKERVKALESELKWFREHMTPRKKAAS